MFISIKIIKLLINVNNVYMLIINM